MLENEKDTVEEANSKVYELGYVLVPTIKEEDVPISYGNIKELIASLDGEIVADEMPKVLNLAYSMIKVISNVRTKFNTGYFGWIKFSMSPSNVLELKKRLDLDLNLIRFLIINTVKENTIATKRFVRGEIYKKPTTKKSSKDDAEALPINKEEIDKEIDALIAV